MHKGAVFMMSQNDKVEPSGLENAVSLSQPKVRIGVVSFEERRTRRGLQVARGLLIFISMTYLLLVKKDCVGGAKGCV